MLHKKEFWSSELMDKSIVTSISHSLNIAMGINFGLEFTPWVSADITSFSGVSYKYNSEHGKVKD